MDPSVTLFGPVDTYLAPVIGYVMLLLIVLNMVGRGVEYNRIASQAEEGAEDLAESAKTHLEELDLDPGPASRLAEFAEFVVQREV